MTNHVITVADDPVSFDGSGLSPGDTIEVQAGTYTGFNFYGLTGTQESPIVMYPSGGLVRVQISGNDVNLFQNSWLWIDGSMVSGLTYGFLFECCIFAYDQSTGLIINNVEVDRSGGYGSIPLGIHIKDDTTPSGHTFNDVEIDHCYLHDVSGEAIYTGKSTYNANYPMNRVNIHHNLIGDCQTGIQVGMCVSDGVVHHNTILNMDPGDGATQEGGISLNAASNVDVYNNYINDSENWGIIKNDYYYASEIYNNVIINCGHTSALGREESIVIYGNDATTIYNNTIITAGSYGIEADSPVEAWNNIILDCGTNPESGTLNYHDNHDDDSYTVAGYGFRDYANDDYHLTSSSPGVGAATGTVPTYDYNDDLRPSPASMGAYEYYMRHVVGHRTRRQFFNVIGR